MGLQAHSAIVLSVGEVGGVDLATLPVRVLFSAPLTTAMRPCVHFLKGACRFQDRGCK